MKIATIFFCLFFHSSVANYEHISKSLNSIDLMSNAIFQVLEEFFIKKSIIFDVITFGEIKNTKIEQILNEIGKKNAGKFSSKLIKYQKHKDLNSLNNSAIVFMKNGKTLDEFNAKVVLHNFFPKPLKFVIFIDDSKNFFNQIRLVKLSNNFGYIEEREFVICDDVVELKLLTFEWYTKDDCNYPSITIQDTFNKSTQKWNKKLKNHEKFRNFHNCPVVASFPLDSPKMEFFINFKTKTAHGLMFDLHKSLAKAGNFSPQISRSRTKRQDPRIQVKYDLKTTAIASTHTTMTFNQNRFIFVITPSEPYTIYEKMFMVFDETTWIFLLITFGVAFTVVFIINTRPIWIQNIVYGEKVKTPSMNILHIFFGIGQLKLPKNSFARFILTNFIFFCLIFRTSYQSILFEFLTTDMRKPLPKTIDDLYFQNFTIITVGIPNVKKHIEEMIDEKRR